MENNTNNSSIIDAFRNAEIISKINDNTWLFKLAGENVWYVVDRQGHTLVRTTPDGKNEFATVDFYDMVGEPYDFQSSSLKDGIVVMKFLCKKQDGKQEENYYEISQSGYTYNATKGKREIYSRLGVDYRSKDDSTSVVNKSPISFEQVELRLIRSQQHLDLLYDIAKNSLMQKYDAFKKEYPIKTPKLKENTFATAARRISKRYEFLTGALEKKQVKAEQKHTEQPKQPE